MKYYYIFIKYRNFQSGDTFQSGDFSEIERFLYVK